MTMSKENGLAGRIASIRSKRLRARQRGWLLMTPRGPGKNQRRTKIYSMWMAVRQRCSNKNMRRAEYYVGKGVKVCDEWQSYPTFRSWVCSRMRQYEGDLRKACIDRINSDGDYCPDNCQIISMSENSRKSSGAMVLVNKRLAP